MELSDNGGVAGKGPALICTKEQNTRGLLAYNIVVHSVIQISPSSKAPT